MRRNIKLIDKRESGQVALIVLIVSAVVLTLGLSTSKRTVTENKITTEEGLLKEAFNVAESGIEYYLSTGSTAYTDVGSSGTAYVYPEI
jgi:Tfp pilus assembly protein PilX